MNQLDQVKPIELVLPPRVGPAQDAFVPVPHASSSLWIAGTVLLIVAANAWLVWWRIRGRDPLRRAFDAAAGHLGLNRKERKHIGEITPKGCPPVALLLSESAMQDVMSGDGNPVTVGIRAKLERVRT